MSNEKEVEVGEFAQKVTAFAKSCCDDASGGKAAIIIIGIDASPEDYNSSVIGVIGQNRLLLEGLTKFIGQPEHLEMVKDALGIAALSKVMSLAKALPSQAEPQKTEPSTEE